MKGTDIAMEKALSLGNLIKDRLSSTYDLVMVDIGSDSTVKKNGTELKTTVYKAGDIGHLCILSMNALLGNGS